jgi:hypothetical protein
MTGVPGVASTPPSSPPTHRQRALHAILALVLALVALGTLVVLGAWLLTRRAPSWWEAPNLADPSIVATAESVERFVSNQLSEHRETDTPWRMAIPEDAATAWLNARLPRWLANREVEWPLEGVPVLVRFGADGSMLLAADTSAHADATRVIGARATPSLDESGPVLRLTEVSLGTLSLPPSFAASTIRRAIPSDSDARAIVGALLDGRPLADHTSIRVDESRRVTIIGLTIEDGVATLTCVTGEAERAR